MRRVGLAVLTLVVSFPLYVMVVTSVEGSSDTFEPFRWIPRHLSLASFRQVWSSIPLGRYMVNSAIVSGWSALLAVAVAAPAAYALARLRIRGRSVVLSSLLATQSAPGMFFLLPLFLLYAQVARSSGVRLIGTFPGLILTDLTFALPISVWMLTSYISRLPVELEEEAQVLGAGPIARFVYVVLPGAAPGIAAVGAFAFALSWGEVLFASVLTDDNTRTVAVGLPTLTTGLAPQWNLLMAASLIAGVPVAVVCIVLRRFLDALVRRSAAR